MEATQLDSSPRVRKLYLKALAALSDELNSTWKRVLPADERWPRGIGDEFFEPFVRFGVALYNAYAQECLQSFPMPTLDSYLHSLNIDLKTRVCNRIAPYRSEQIRTLQDAIEADKRGEVPDEWTLRMGESWRQFHHPRHGEAQATVRRVFFDPFDDELSGARSRLVERIHKAVSLRVPHWLAAHGEIAEEAQPQPESAAALMQPEPAPTQREPAPKPSRRRGPKRDYETAARVAEIVARVSPEEGWRSNIDDILMALDEAAIPTPKGWGPKHGYRDWYAAVAADNAGRGRHMAIEAIKHRLKRAKELLTKTIP